MIKVSFSKTFLDSGKNFFGICTSSVGKTHYILWTNARNVNLTLQLSFLVFPRCAKHGASQGGLVICFSSFPQLLPECPVVTVTLTSTDRLRGFPQESVAGWALPLTIMVWVLCVGSRLLVTSPRGPCLAANHSLESANWHNRTESLCLGTA